MKLKKVVLTFAAGLALQAGIYYYLDNVLFAATSDYQIDGTNKPVKKESRKKSVCTVANCLSSNGCPIGIWRFSPHTDEMSVQENTEYTWLSTIL